MHNERLAGLTIYMFLNLFSLHADSFKCSVFLPTVRRIYGTSTTGALTPPPLPSLSPLTQTPSLAYRPPNRFSVMYMIFIP